MKGLQFLPSPHFTAYLTHRLRQQTRQPPTPCLAHPLNNLGITVRRLLMTVLRSCLLLTGGLEVSIRGL